MTKLAWRRAALPAVLLAAGLSAPAGAHPDDPKILDLRQPYEGPGYRSGDPLAGEFFPSEKVTLRAWLPLAELYPGSVSGNDCWGYVSPSGREYALIGVSHGTVIVEVTDPGNPVVVDTKVGPVNLWHDIKIYGQHAYAVSEGGRGIRVLDLSQVDVGIVTQQRFGSETSHNVAINTDSGRLYRLGGDAWGMAIFSLADPANPVEIGAWADVYIHDAQVVSYTDGPLAGREVMFACVGGRGMRVLDVTDPGAVAVLSEFHYGEEYAHQCWLSPDRRTLYIGDELDEMIGGTTRTYVYDVSDPTRPQSRGQFTNEATSTDHNMYTKGTLLFQANYRTGLRVFDATVPTRPVEVAWFDTFPEDDENNLNGLWSNFPSFPSGTIIGSDMQRGLFIWTLEEYPLSLALPDGPFPEISRPGDAIAIDVVRNVPQATWSAAPLLHLDSGSGFETFPLQPQPDGGYVAQLPGDLCNRDVSYYVSVSDDEGRVATSPADAPASTYTTFVGGAPRVMLADSFEVSGGWTVNFDGTDTATGGAWTRGDPLGSLAEPADDVTPDGTLCWYTGAGEPGGTPSSHDVDGGRTTLVSPAWDVSEMAAPAIAYWRWFSNNTANGTPDDAFNVQVSDDDGASWALLERVRADAHEAGGGWYRHVARIGAVVSTDGPIRVRFVASDRNENSRVEAAIDDVQVLDLSCGACPGDVDGDGLTGLYELGLVLAQFGQTGADWAGDLTGDRAVTLEDLAIVLERFGQGCS